jgi:hypothetical protein
MARSFDYSKWDNIELSDDESDLHPNIDKDSWFRMKHRSRLEREEKEDAQVAAWDKLSLQEGTRVATIRARLAGLQQVGAYLTTSLPHYITASLHHYITASLHHYITASLHHCLTTSLPHYITTSLPHYITASLHHCLTTSLHHYITYMTNLLIFLTCLQLIAAGDEEAELEDQDALQGELAELTAAIDERNKKIAEIKERRSWNIDNICHVAEEKTFVNNPEISSLKAKDFVPTGQTEAAMNKNKAEKEDVAQSEKPAVVTKEVSTSGVTSALKSSSLTAPPLPAASGSTPVSVPTQQVVTVSRDDPTEKRSAISYNDYVLKHEEMLEFYSDIPTLERTKDYLVKNGGVRNCYSCFHYLYLSEVHVVTYSFVCVCNADYVT